MMMNLFSVFDPTTSIFSMAWLAILLPGLIIPMKIWNVTYPFMKTKESVTLKFKKEVEFALTTKEKSTENFIMTIFFSILLLNILALYPQIFSPTSHLTTNLPLSMSFWMGLMIFGWTKNTKHMLAHLVPQGTPSSLMMFMVLIEMTSNLIRPVTLCVRLTANMIAGHLLMTLLGNMFVQSSSFMMILMIPAPIMLSVLESAVACIQAYVFMTLVTLYTTELK